MSDDLHRPTTAGPTPPAADPAQPTQEQPAAGGASGAVSTAQEKVADAASTAQEKAGEAQQKVTEAAQTAQAKAADVQATAQAKIAEAQAAASEKPEVQVGLAFAGGFVAAFLLKRLTR